jgi:hypothetical protein
MTSHPKTPHIVLAIDYGTTFSGQSVSGWFELVTDAQQVFLGCMQVMMGHFPM